MRNTVQIVLNSNTKLFKSKYDLTFAVNINLKVPDKLDVLSLHYYIICSISCLTCATIRDLRCERFCAEKNHEQGSGFNFLC